MAIRPLFPLTKQFQARNGQNNVSGTLEVFYAYTDDRAPTYSDYNGTRNPDLVPIDNNGRAVVLCDDERVYRLVVRDRSGGILWTQEPTVCEGEGSGGSTSIVSEDGSIVVQRTGSVYDLSVNHTDDSRFLDWIRCTGGESVSGYLRPVKAAGTMAVGSLGLSLSPDVLYHVTATVRAVKGSVAPVYGEVSVTLALHDGETATSVRTFSEIADCSMGLSQDYIVEADVHTPSNATQLVFSATGDDASLSFLLLSVDAHRVYSGVPRIPDEVAQKTWVDANFQKKLVAGANITIDPVTNTISADALTQVQADWAQSDPADMSYIKNKPTVDQVYDASSTNAQSGTAVAEAIAGVDNTFIAVYGVTPIGEVDTAYSQGKDIVCRYNDGHGHVYSSQLSSLVSGMYTFSTTEWFTDYEFRLSPNGGTGDWSISSRVIPSGTQLVPAATQSDAGEVLTVDQNGVPEWAPAQAPVSAGNGIDITNNVISIDTSVVATQTDLTNGLATKQDTISDLNTIRSGAQAGATAVQDPDYVHTDNNFTDADVTKLFGIQAGAEVNVQANWNESDSTSDSFILNKPTIPSGSQLVPSATPSDAGEVLTVDQNGVPEWAPAQAPISAGNGISISGTTVSAKVDGTTVTFNASGELEATAAPQLNADWDATSGVQEILHKPDLSQYATQTDLAGKQDTLTAGSNITIINDVISATAAPQVNADWDATSGVAEILNKPVIPVIPPMKKLVAGTGVNLIESTAEVTISTTTGTVVDSNYVHTDNNFTNAEKTKLSGIEAGAEVNVIETVKVDDIPLTVTNKTVNIDLTDKADKAVPSAAGNLAGLDAAGNLTDSGISGTLDLAPTENSGNLVTSGAVFDALGGKTDKVSGATDGNFAGLDANGNLKDSGKNASDFATAAQGETADTAVQSVKLDGNELKSGTDVVIPLAENTAGTGTAGAMSGADKVKLDSVAAGAEVNVQADWTEADTSSDAYIQNKPDLSVYATNTALTNGLATKQDTISDLSTIRSGAQAGATAVQPGDLARVANTGAYSDLSGTPTINNVPAVTSVDDGKVLTASYSGGVGSYSWASGGGGGTVDQTYDPTSTNAQSGTAVAQAVSGKEDEFDAGEGLEFTTDGQGNRILQVEGPVDIVAGPGIVIDNPDGNTIRVSQATPCDETTLWTGTYSGSVSDNNYITLSESPANFETIEIRNGGNYKSLYRFDGSSTVWSFMQTYADGNGTTVYANRYLVDAQTNKVTCKSCNVFVVSPNRISNWAAAGMNVGEVQLTKVVGIHRIANN